MTKTLRCEPCDGNTRPYKFVPDEDELLPVDCNGEPTTATRSNLYCSACGTNYPSGLLAGW